MICFYRYLDLTECAGLEDEGLCTIAINCPKLRELNLSWCWSVTDISFKIIVQMCPEITKMNLLGVNKLTIGPFKNVSTSISNAKGGKNKMYNLCRPK